QIYKNNGESEFVLTYEEEISGGIDDQEIVELNGDGYIDIVYRKDLPGYNKVFVRMNSGIGGFLDEISYTTSEYVHRCASADLDGNGYNDIVTVHSLAAYLEGNLHVLFNDGTGDFVEDPVTGINENNAQPTEFTLFQNYPNPFNGITTIQYELPIESSVTIKLYDSLGREITTILNEKKEAGKHKTELDFKKYKLSSGLYFCTLYTKSAVITTKIIYLK
ncbi:MAG: T9SS type A sorting domain-containing protein, partial [Melioribacteraceae bacterium]|nr:T9SS type A sorting domain-containing protein [Melioribacteraceae bacterium]